MGFSFGYFIGSLVVCCFFGAITKYISGTKGYEGGFWWGFFLSFIGIIVVACRPDKREPVVNVIYNNMSTPQTKPTVEAPSPASNVSDISARRTSFEKLKQLHEQGLLNDAEFEDKSILLRCSGEARRKISNLNELNKQGILDQETLQAKTKIILDEEKARIHKYDLDKELWHQYSNGTISQDEYLSKKSAMFPDAATDLFDKETILADISGMQKASDIPSYLEQYSWIFANDNTFSLLQKGISRIVHSNRNFNAIVKDVSTMISLFCDNGMKIFEVDPNSDTIICPICGTIVFSYNPFCDNCHAIFITK